MSGLAVGLQIMAYGADRPVPFHQGICESQALEPGITGNFSINAMRLVADAVGCNTTDLHSNQTVACLRALDTETLQNATTDTYLFDIAHNIGDIWLPVVDGDFLPAAPSQLITESRFANVTTMIGWADNDLTFFTPFDIQTDNDTRDFATSYVPDMTSENINRLLSLYPVSDFPANPSANLSAQFYRSARIFRDILMTCMPIWYGQNLAKMGNAVYYYDFNQTMLDDILASQGVPGLGPIHTSEFAYIFGNLSHYNVNDYPYYPNQSDFRLRDQASRSWSTFASLGQPSLTQRNTLKGWDTAFTTCENTDTENPEVYVAGGPHEGLSRISGAGAHPALRAQKLGERCGFLNSPEIIEQLRF